MEIGKRIRNLRLSKDLSVNGLAKKAYISRSYLSDIENGRTAPSLDKLTVICDVLDISLSEFFGDVPALPAEIIKLIESARKLTDEEIKLLTDFLEVIGERNKGM
ncbi:helix-turn-helix domain-containing protein [Oceanobacillus sp. CFH 90083]|uniref:helix-turn-helix domain-containing protein n=1 Tax=Oceanobacillus sp. CFH 90083 TaxID=2592336 RepID=UPI00128C977E|nr:helix-turn-helix transcriptional regulator [Oceanobacillus sp. CFH 90083]